MDAGIVELLRSLGYGALFGGGIMGLVYSLFAADFAVGTSFNQMLVAGGLLGAGLHRIIDRYIVDSILRPITGFIGYYSSLAQLLFLRRSGIITRRHADELLQSVTKQYFLNSSPQGTARQLPPADG